MVLSFTTFINSRFKKNAIKQNKLDSNYLQITFGKPSHQIHCLFPVCHSTTVFPQDQSSAKLMCLT